MPDLPTVSVIVPTMGLKARALSLQRAIDSILTQDNVHANPIVVVNGPQRDAALVAALRQITGVRVLEVEEQSLPNALRIGREAVTGDWFAAIDDDDIYLPEALASRVQALQSRPEFDTVVTNGFVCESGIRTLHMHNMSIVGQDPLAALNQKNWLLPGAWLCRTERVGSWLFESMPKALECTFLALQFSIHCNFCTLDTPTVVWHKDTLESESKSRDYIFNQAAALEQLIELQLPVKARKIFGARITASRHQIADLLLRERDLGSAWRWHLLSLWGRHGWRYLPFSLHLLRASLWR